MPAVFVLDPWHALALDRVGDDHRRPVGVHGLFIGCHDLRQVMSVDRDRIPAEGLHAFLVRADVVAVHRLPPLPQPVDVNDTDETAQIVVGGDLNRFPVAALRHLAVAKQHIGTVRQLVQIPRIERLSHSYGQSLPERARRRFHVTKPRRRVALQFAAELPVAHDLFRTHGIGR